MKKFFTILGLLFSAPAFAGTTLHPIFVQTQDKSIHKFMIELAVTPETREQGLMFRKTMPDNQGMLFEFDTPQMVYFWMKNTFIPLDILFADSQGVIRKIHGNAQPGDLTQVSSGAPVKAVLELNAGTVQKLGIQPGDRMTLIIPAKQAAKPSPDSSKTVAKP